MNRDDIILLDLQSKGTITGLDYDPTVHYKDAIMNLRNKGHDIRMTYIPHPRKPKVEKGRKRYHCKKKEQLIPNVIDENTMTLALRELLTLCKLKKHQSLFGRKYKKVIKLLTHTKQNQKAIKWIRSQVLGLKE